MFEPAQGQLNAHKPDQGQLSTCMQSTFFVIFWVPKRIVSGSNYVRDIVLQDMLQHQINSWESKTRSLDIFRTHRRFGRHVTKVKTFRLRGPVVNPPFYTIHIPLEQAKVVREVIHEVFV
jgi:hypothetical protein